MATFTRTGTAGATAFALILVIGACGGSATPAPAAATPSPVATQAATPAPATPAASDSGGSTTIDVTGLDQTPVEKMCGLVSVDEAQRYLGKTLSQPPNGLLLKGLGTNCIYQTDDAMTDGTYLKVEINSVSYKANTGLLFLGGTPETFTVDGFEASGIDAGVGGTKQATLAIKLSNGENDPAMVIQAPTLAMGKEIADAVLRRLGQLK